MIRTWYSLHYHDNNNNNNNKNNNNKCYLARVISSAKNAAINEDSGKKKMKNKIK